MRSFAIVACVCVASCGGHSAKHPDAPPPTVTVPTVTGFAVLPAATFAAGPTSGKALASGNTNGEAFPLVDKQPVQGFSGMVVNPDGSVWALVDNGFGSKANSADHLLRIYKLRIMPTESSPAGAIGPGSVTVERFLPLNDRNHKLGFPIVNANTTERLLTGADLDPEAMFMADDGTFWLGDEFGPFLLHVATDGTLLEAPFDLPSHLAAGETLKTPQHPSSPAAASALVQASGGFENLARIPGTTQAIAMLEKPLTNAPTRNVLMAPFDVASKRFGEARYYYPLDEGAQSVGDIAMVSATQGLALERDNFEGDAAAIKRLYKFTLGASGSVVQKELVADLLNLALANPDLLSGHQGTGLTPTYSMPFITIENVVILGPSRLLIVNDNNYPFSVGRHTNMRKPDDTEFVFLSLPTIL